MKVSTNVNAFLTASLLWSSHQVSSVSAVSIPGKFDLSKPSGILSKTTGKCWGLRGEGTSSAGMTPMDCTGTDDQLFEAVSDLPPDLLFGDLYGEVPFKIKSVKSGLCIASYDMSGGEFIAEMKDCKDADDWSITPTGQLLDETIKMKSGGWKRCLSDYTDQGWAQILQCREDGATFAALPLDEIVEASDEIISPGEPEGLAPEAVVPAPVPDVPPLARLSDNVAAWTGDADALIDGDMETTAVSYGSETCNVGINDVGYVTIDMGEQQSISGLDIILEGNKACNLFVNIWNEGEDEPLVPFDEPITALPTQAPTKKATQAPTNAPTQAPKAITALPTQAPTKKATQAPTNAPTQAPKAVTGAHAKSVKCQVCDPQYPPDLCELQGFTKEIECEYPNNHCINVVETHSSGTRDVKRSCGNKRTCELDWWQSSSDIDVCQMLIEDPNQLYAINKHCTFCCDKDNCNKGDAPAHDDMWTPYDRRHLASTIGAMKFDLSKPSGILSKATGKCWGLRGEGTSSAGMTPMDCTGTDDQLFEAVSDLPPDLLFGDLYGKVPFKIKSVKSGLCIASYDMGGSEFIAEMKDCKDADDWSITPTGQLLDETIKMKSGGWKRCLSDYTDQGWAQILQCKEDGATFAALPLDEILEASDEIINPEGAALPAPEPVVQKSNVYSSGTSHEYTPELPENTLSVNFPERNARYVRVWIGKQFGSSTTGIIEITATDPSGEPVELDGPDTSAVTLPVNEVIEESGEFTFGLNPPTPVVPVPVPHPVEPSQQDSLPEKFDLSKPSGILSKTTGKCWGLRREGTSAGMRPMDCTGTDDQLFEAVSRLPLSIVFGAAYGQIPFKIRSVKSQKCISAYDMSGGDFIAEMKDCKDADDWSITPTGQLLDETIQMKSGGWKRCLDDYALKGWAQILRCEDDGSTFAALPLDEIVGVSDEIINPKNDASLPVPGSLPAPAFLPVGEPVTDPAGPAPAPRPDASASKNASASKRARNREVRKKFGHLPIPEKPAVTPASFEEMKKAPKGLVSDTGVCTTLDEDLNFVAVDCSLEGSIELIYDVDSKQVKLIEKEGHGRLLAGTQAVSRQNQKCLQTMPLGNAKFAPCGPGKAFQWSNSKPGFISSDLNDNCLDMPDKRSLDFSNPPAIMTQTCAPNRSSQRWKFQTTGSAKQAASHGDPHFKTFSGHKYDFHGGCDLVLFDNNNFANGLGMTVHVRTKVNTWWSYIESAVLRLGPNALEVMGGPNGGQFWINGKLQVEPKDGEIIVFSGYQVSFHRRTKNSFRFRLDFEQGMGDVLALETFKDFVSVNVRAKTDQFLGSVGLLGSFPEGKMLARDGKTVMEDADAFGKEWQVLASERMMFHVKDGPQHPQECAMPEMTATGRKIRRLGEALVTEEDAAIACAHVDEEDQDACIFDVLATNDKEMGGAY